MNLDELHARAVRRRDMAPHVDRLIEYARGCRVIVEFGVRHGVSTLAFLMGLPADGRLVSVDINEHQVPEADADSRWTFIQGDDRDPKVQGRLPHDPDLVFIDTSHVYEHTLAELRLATTSAVRTVLLHDAGWPGVRRAIDEFTAEGHWRESALYPASDRKGDFSLAVLEPMA